MHIFYNVVMITVILHQLAQAGFIVTEEDIGTVRQYLRERIKRFEHYSMVFELFLTEIDYTLPTLSANSGSSAYAT